MSFYIGYTRINIKKKQTNKPQKILVLALSFGINIFDMYKHA